MNETKQTIVDIVDGNTTYYGETKLGRGTSADTWKIRKVVIAGAITTTYYPQYTNGKVSDAPLFTWDDRASLTYSLTDDTVIPNTPAWTVGVLLKSTVYTARKITLTVGSSGISSVGLIVTADAGVVSNVSVLGGVITFDYTTPNAIGDTINISGVSGSGIAFTETLDTPALS